MREEKNASSLTFQKANSCVPNISSSRPCTKAPQAPEAIRLTVFVSSFSLGASSAHFLPEENSPEAKRSLARSWAVRFLWTQVRDGEENSEWGGWFCFTNWLRVKSAYFITNFRCLPWDLTSASCPEFAQESEDWPEVLNPDTHTKKSHHFMLWMSLWSERPFQTKKSWDDL